MTKGHNGRISYFSPQGHFLANLWEIIFMMGWQEKQNSAVLRHGMAVMKNELFTWKDIRKIPTLFRFSRNRQADDIKSAMGSIPTHSSQTDEINVGPRWQPPKGLKELKDEIGKLLAKMLVQHYKQAPRRPGRLWMSFCSLEGVKGGPGSLGKASVSSVSNIQWSTASLDTETK